LKSVKELENERKRGYLEEMIPQRWQILKTLVKQRMRAGQHTEGRTQTKTNESQKRLRFVAQQRGHAWRDRFYLMWVLDNGKHFGLKNTR
jgi:hypothetical protein